MCTLCSACDRNNGRVKSHNKPIFVWQVFHVSVHGQYSGANYFHRKFTIQLKLKNIGKMKTHWGGGVGVGSTFNQIRVCHFTRAAYYCHNGNLWPLFTCHSFWFCILINPEGQRHIENPCQWYNHKDDSLHTWHLFILKMCINIIILFPRTDNGAKQLRSQTNNQLSAPVLPLHLLYHIKEWLQQQSANQSCPSSNCSGCKILENSKICPQMFCYIHSIGDRKCCSSSHWGILFYSTKG